MKSFSLFALLLLAAGSAQAVDVHLYAALESTPMVPKADSNGAGEVTAVLHDDGKLQINAIFSGVGADITEVALHTGASNATGPAVAQLDVRTTPAGQVVNQQLTLDAATAAAVRAGNSYLLVVTTEHSTGALRGQLAPQPLQLPPTP
jgi:CHRD domain-containing protein